MRQVLRPCSGAIAPPGHLRADALRWWCSLPLVAHLDAPGHQGQAAVAVYGVPVHFALKALRSMRAATRFAAMGASNVVGCAVDAAPSRAGPRLNSPCTTRTAAGQRRITARVMRPFGRRLPHTLPFQAHPRVASRPKSPAPFVATLFGLPATLRAGTESVLFPWRCSRRGRTLWVVRTAPQSA